MSGEGGPGGRWRQKKGLDFNSTDTVLQIEKDRLYQILLIFPAQVSGIVSFVMSALRCSENLKKNENSNIN